MKFSRADITLMRASLVSLASALVFSLSLLIFAAKQADSARAENHAAQQQLHTAQGELIRAQQAQLDRQNYQAEYAQAVAQHRIGDEPRMDWMDILASLRTQHPNADFHYQITAQKTYAAQPDSGNFGIADSTMTWRLTLRHEGQLLDFLDALQERGNGQYLNTNCAIKRNASALTADCTGEWLTLQPHPAP